MLQREKLHRHFQNTLVIMWIR